MADDKPPLPEIDDPEDLQDHVIRQKLKTTPDFRIGKQTYVIGSDPLPPRWQALLRRTSSLSDASDLVRRAIHHGLDPAEIRLLVRRLHIEEQRATQDEIVAQIAGALVTGQLWVLRKNALPPKGRADPAVFAQLNATYGTKVDFAFLAEWEGGQYLHGYVPFAKGIVAGHSGMTIATGFDIGQKSTAEIKQMAISDDLRNKIVGFAAHQFTGLNHDQVVAEVAKMKVPVPVITKADADLLDKLVHGEHLAAAIAAWDGARKPGVPAFTALPEAWQTVLFSRFFHQGKGANRTAVIKKFWAAATAGEWETAVTDLENYPVTAGWYKTRVKKEARHLATQIPAYRPPPKPPGKTAPPVPGKPPQPSLKPLVPKMH